MKILGISSAETLIWCGAVSAALASVLAFYSNNVIGKIVRALLKAEAIGADNAKTLKELGCDSVLCRFALRKGSMQDGAVCSAEEGYYIVEDKLEKMEAKHGGSDASAWVLVIVLLAVAVAAAIIAAVYPSFAKLIKGIL